jgi:hypothetical protein
MIKRPRRPGQSWETLLRNHADGITAADLFVVRQCQEFRVRAAG